ncbi:DUF2652 domain-containing protein [Flavitalea sp.]|nr:DUF2652 domain-containing protein [Flavitalea sp.]
MKNKGLLFIPDISGFTEFVTNIELAHSHHIIHELIEVLIDENEMGLEVSEIEGDAVLFYKFGDLPELSLIYEQVESMFFAFHKQLKIYELHRTCQCKACRTAINLTLKFITHYGEFTGYKIKNFYTLIGEDVIIAHQLLKNTIDKHEYWLVTKGLANDNLPGGFRKWMKWDKSNKQIGGNEVSFLYTQLSPLKAAAKTDNGTQPNQ